MWIKVIIKVVLSGFLFLLCLGIYLDVKWENSPYNVNIEMGKYTLTSIQNHYEQEDFGYVKYMLDLYQLYDTEYDMYWEGVNGFIDYQDALQYKKSNDIPEKEECARKVIDNAENCKYAENKEVLEKWAKAVQKKGF